MQIHLRSSRIKPLYVIGGLFAFLALAYMLGGFARQKDPGAAVKQRLTLVWPDLMQMDEADRKVLAVLAADCGLAEVVPARDQVVRCLRRAAADPLLDVPNGGGGVPGSIVLEAMLRYADRIPPGQ
ncbi:hypothetical protein NB700_001832 [Xanthomonas sacchari]|uniref:Uncharacterized protein n=1 Tax=Xanthomonas sacchari TaxID=56458 RepID=A0ABT3DVA7_9XANT|nr:hypothetical protein [Xanthomonas sacchari]MCW0399276.1 hypothetical protein [Xanthomonas sacchari]